MLNSTQRLFIFGCAGSSLLCMCFSLVLVNGGSSLIAVLELLTVVASLIAEHGLLSTGSRLVAHRLCCFLTCGIFLDQGLNPCPLHWQVDS